MFRFQKFSAALIAFLLCLPGVSWAESVAGSLVPIRLRCEYLADPLGIDVPNPRLCWALKIGDGKTQRGQKQSAYQVLVATSDELLGKEKPDLWDTGKVVSDATLQIEYAGKPLAGRTRCHWKVRVWDSDDRVSEWSTIGSWEMGLLKPDDWTARWIGDGRENPTNEADFFKNDPAPLLRKEFSIDKPVRRARLYVTGLGYYCAKLNGKDVGNRALDPGWTNYQKRVLYSTFDVTPRIVQGKNAIGMMLGNGWYNPLPLKMWNHLDLRKFLPVGRPRAIAQLEIELADGTRQTIVTGEDWKTSPGPILRNSIFLGEVYDARLEKLGWDAPEFDDSTWTAAKIAVEPIGPLCAQMQPPVRVTAKLKPLRKTEPSPGVFIFDMGQNFAGWAKLRVKGPAGTVVKMRFGELLNPDGTLNLMTGVCGQIKNGDENRDEEYPKLAYQGDTYILSGRDDEVYCPRFTWHGFRFVEVTGYPGSPATDAIEGLRLSADVNDVGEFSCSNERFNRIQNMVRWTFLSNLFSVQSDCPTRERFGYGGDIVPTCDAFMLNFDMAAFYTKTVRDFADAARENGGMTETAPYVGVENEGFGGGTGPIGWQVAFPLLQEKLYQYYGDTRLIKEQYAASKRQLDFLVSVSKGNLIERCIGDHESIDPKPTALTSAAFYYQHAAAVAKFAKILDKKEDAEKYGRLADEIRQAFVDKFFRPRTGRFDSGSQTCQAFALHYGMVPPDYRRAALKVLAYEVQQRHDGHLATGIFGTRYLLEQLSRGGRADLAFGIVNQESFPGWGHTLERGATTLWEHWEYSDNTYSHNHPMFGSVSAWFFEDIGGIRPDADAVGFDRIVVQPRIVGGMTHAKAQCNTIRGRVGCEWDVKQGRLEMKVSVPPGVTAKIYVPSDGSTSIFEGDVPADQAPGLELLESRPDAGVFRAGGGHYLFKSTPPSDAEAAG